MTKVPSSSTRDVRDDKDLHKSDRSRDKTRSSKKAKHKSHRSRSKDNKSHSNKNTSRRENHSHSTSKDFGTQKKRKKTEDKTETKYFKENKGQKDIGKKISRSEHSEKHKSCYHGESSNARTHRDKNETKIKHDYSTHKTTDKNFAPKNKPVESNIKRKTFQAISDVKSDSKSSDTSFKLLSRDNLSYITRRALRGIDKGLSQKNDILSYSSHRCRDSAGHKNDSRDQESKLSEDLIHTKSKDGEKQTSSVENLELPSYVMKYLNSTEIEGCKLHSKALVAIDWKSTLNLDSSSCTPEASTKKPTEYKMKKFGEYCKEINHIFTDDPFKSEVSPSFTKSSNLQKDFDILVKAIKNFSVKFKPKF